MKRRAGWALAFSFLATAFAAACGARTELEIAGGKDDGFGGSVGSGGSGANGQHRPHDAGSDVPVHVEECTDPSESLVFLVTKQSQLLRFDLTTNSFKPRGFIACSGFPFSLAIDRRGNGWMVFEPGGDLARFSTANGACTAASYEKDQHGFRTFGMAFATDGDGSSEQLYVADSNEHGPSKGLAKLDTDTLTLDFIGPFSQDLGDRVELTGTGDGRLFGFFTRGGASSHLAEIDKASGAILSDKVIELGSPDPAFAFVFSGGSFYIFTDDGFGGATTITKYDPTTEAQTKLPELDTNVVAGGISTCAPQ